MFTARSSGILLHPTSLPSSFGIGDLGDEAFQWVDWLSRAGQRWWQILPLSPTCNLGSPYTSPAAFAGNPLLISPDRLVHYRFLTEAEAATARDDSGPASSRVHFDQVRRRKSALLHRAFERLARHPLTPLFEDFCHAQSSWLDDYALFTSLKEINADRAWTDWSEGVEPVSKTPLPDTRARVTDRIKFYQFEQFIFDLQWLELREHARSKGISIIGDIPIYVAHDSADVYRHRDLFLLDATGRPTHGAGVPPDYFAATGQLWNNPLYDWPEMQRRGFSWWIDRLRAALRWVDVVRIDHFRGFEAYWSVPAGETTAINGQWMKGPGDAFFQAMAQALGGDPQAMPLIAEDLGTITEEVTAMRRRAHLPGMRVLHFEFLDPAESAMQVENYPVDSAVYTGTHDNDTTVGWFEAEIRPDAWRWDRLKRVVRAEAETIAWDLIGLAWKSPGILAVAPIQDVLSLGPEARMNKPGTVSPDHPNWQWRYDSIQLTPELAERLAQLTASTNRSRD